LTFNLVPEGSRQRAKPYEADMKTLAIILISAVPAMASVPQKTTETHMQVGPQAVAMKDEPSTDGSTCGEAQEMIIIVRDENGSVVATGKAHVAPAC